MNESTVNAELQSCVRNNNESGPNQGNKISDVIFNVVQKNFGCRFNGHSEYRQVIGFADHVDVLEREVAKI